MYRSAVRPLIYLVLWLIATDHAVSAQTIIPSPPQLAAEAYLLMDADSGRMLVDQNGSQRLPPASLTKIMTSYVAASELASGRIKLDDQVDISVKAWRMGGSRMYVREGTKVSLEDLLRGIIIQSGNDASVAVAEHIAGSEEAFVEVMNQRAILLGMKDTQFVNATGWPDENHYTTAYDMAVLAGSLIRDYPDHYSMYAEKYFSYNNIRQPNRNSLLWRDKSVDGVKTGHTEVAGYCLVTSATRQGMRLISVLMGAKNEEARAAESQKLLTYGFRFFETHRLYDAAATLSKNRIWGGDDDSIDLGLQSAVVITIPRGTKKDLSAKMEIDNVIEAPFEAGTQFGSLTISIGDDVIHEIPLTALKSVPESGLFSGTWDDVHLFALQLFGLDTMH
jgi:D-alanyl-D-alanine carboxypeptidase (penicillin-binding protein 5/6)